MKLTTLVPILLAFAWQCSAQMVLNSGSLQSYAFAPAATGGGSYSLMQQSLTNSTGSTTIFNYYRYASPFYASNNMTVKGIEVFIKTNGAAISASTIWLGVFTSSGNQPSTMVANGASTSATLSTLAPYHGNWYSFTNFNCSLTSGTLYWMIASNTVWQTSGAIEFWNRAVPPTAPATNVLQADISSWSTSVPNSQFAYRIYGE